MLILCNFVRFSVDLSMVFNLLARWHQRGGEFEGIGSVSVSQSVWEVESRRMCSKGSSSLVRTLFTVRYVIYRQCTSSQIDDDNSRMYCMNSLMSAKNNPTTSYYSADLSRLFPLNLHKNSLGSNTNPQYLAKLLSHIVSVI